MIVKVNIIKKIKEGTGQRGKWVMYAIKGDDTQTKGEVDTPLFWGETALPFNEGDVVSFKLNETTKGQNLKFLKVVKTKDDDMKEKAGLAPEKPQEFGKAVNPDATIMNELSNIQKHLKEITGRINKMADAYKRKELQGIKEADEQYY